MQFLISLQLFTGTLLLIGATKLVDAELWFMVVIDLFLGFFMYVLAVLKIKFYL